jgi:type II secretory pathway pseudopilin PulG
MLLHLQKHQINRQLRQQSTRAMTMIELLVVITIILVLTGVMIPTIRYQYRNRALREAERQLNAFIGSAQARAQQLGRPVGIWIDRFSESETLIGANYAVAIYIAEIPRPYTGETRNELVRVVQINNILSLRFNNSILSGDRLIKPGDRFKIQFNHRGPYYEARRDDVTDDYYLYVPNTNFGRIPTPTAAVSVAPRFQLELSKGVPYKIQRQPKKSFLPPLRLPAGAVIDLSVSGTGSSGDEFWTQNKKDPKPVIIMFQSDGSIDRVLYKGKDTRPVGWVHLLVGRQNQVFPEIEILDPPITGKPIGFNRFTDESTETGNVMDMENRWVSINHRTGSITSEQVVGNIPPIKPKLDRQGKLRITAARELVRTGTGSGGN